MNSLDDLPEEIILHIFNFVDFDSLDMLILTCKKFERIGKESLETKTSLKQIYRQFNKLKTNSYLNHRYKPLISY